jgi:hypothetical protein
MITQILYSIRIALKQHLEILITAYLHNLFSRGGGKSMQKGETTTPPDLHLKVNLLFVHLSIFLFAFVLSVLRFTDSDYQFGIFKLVMRWLKDVTHNVVSADLTRHGMPVKRSKWEILFWGKSAGIRT